MLKIKRVYEPCEKSDGFRILVDRLWPRNMSKEKAKIDLWLKDIAPGTELRKWFGHDPKKWPEFRKRYLKELEDKEDLLNQIEGKSRRGRVTLLYGAKDASHNNAVVIMDLLMQRVPSAV